MRSASKRSSQRVIPYKEAISPSQSRIFMANSISVVVTPCLDLMGHGHCVQLLKQSNIYRCHFALPAVVKSLLFQFKFVFFGKASPKTVLLSSAKSC
jgi:hypothetical protein